MNLLLKGSDFTDPVRLSCLRVNGIEFEEVKVDIARRQHLSPEFKGNPRKKESFDFF